MLKVASGYRASKVIGETVVNEANDTVGQDGKAPFAVLSVGGFLGVGSRYVAVPYESLKTNGKKQEDGAVRAGATPPARPTP